MVKEWNEFWLLRSPPFHILWSINNLKIIELTGITIGRKIKDETIFKNSVWLRTPIRKRTMTKKTTKSSIDDDDYYDWPPPHIISIDSIKMKCKTSTVGTNHWSRLEKQSSINDEQKNNQFCSSGMFPLEIVFNKLLESRNKTNQFMVNL